MLDSQIDDFWNWFTRESKDLKSTDSDMKFLRALDTTISSWGFGWEIGPGIEKDFSFTISPSGDLNLLQLTDRIIERAPILEKWEFYSWKQAKESWNIVRNFAEMFEFKANDWQYVLLKYPDNKTEILVKTNNLEILNKKQKELAVDLVLTNLLGEKRKMEEIDFISVVDQFESDKGITELKFLPAHLKKI
jgi:hypothetical protein